jgi:hypothetical protein
MLLPDCFTLLARYCRVTWKARSTPMPRHFYHERDYAFGQAMIKLRRDRPYERLNITDIQGLTEAQKASLRALANKVFSCR